jgi:hypothetical protein
MLTRGFAVLFLGEERDLYFLQYFRIGSNTNLASYSMPTGDSFLRVTAVGA